MDERPVNHEERRLNDAWGLGGKDAEMEERRKIGIEKKEETKVNKFKKAISRWNKIQLVRLKRKKKKNIWKSKKWSIRRAYIFRGIILNCI